MAVPGEDTNGENGCLLPGDQETTPRMKKLIVAVVAVSNMFAWLCISIIAPFYPIEAAAKDVSETVIGFVYSCSELVIFLSSPVFGKCLSRFNPKYIYISGLLVFGSCELVFGFLDQLPAGTVFTAVSFLLRVLQAIGTAGLLTSSFAIMASQYPERIGAVFGLLETVSGLGFLIGPALGAPLYQASGFGLPFWVLGAAVFLFGVVSCLVLPSKLCVSDHSTSSSCELFRSPLVWYGCHCVTAGFVAFSIWAPIIAIHLQQFQLEPSLASLILVIPGLFYSPTTPLWGVLLDKQVPPLLLTTSGLVAGSVVMLFFGPAPFFTFTKPTLWLIIGTAALHGLAQAPAIVSGMRCVMQGARNLGYPDNQTTFGLVGGVVMSSISLGTFIGSSLGGILGDHFGFEWTMVACSISLLLPVLWFGPVWLLLKCRGGKHVAF